MSRPPSGPLDRERRWPSRPVQPRSIRVTRPEQREELGWLDDRWSGPGDRRNGRQGSAAFRHLLEAAGRPPPCITTSKCERPREETEMPVAYVDIPTGVNDGAKKKIFQELYEEIHEAWPIPDTRVLIREWPNEAVSQDGRIENVPMRPICTLAVPPGLEHDAKQKLVWQISNTIGEASSREVEEIRLPSGTKIYNNWVLTFVTG